MRLIYLCLAFTLAACSQASTSESIPSEGSHSGAHEPRTDLVDATEVFIHPDAFRKCGLEPQTPQVYVFEHGEFASSELGYSPGAALAIETGGKGRLAEQVDVLESCVVGEGVDFSRWRDCGTDYCVVRVIPARAGTCPYCDSTQQELDRFFSSRQASVAYRDVFLGTRQMRSAPAAE